MNKKDHWEKIYHDKSPVEVSWHQEEPTVSLALIRNLALQYSDYIIDVGAGTSTLCDCLLAEGYQHLTALDLSSSALAYSQQRLGDKADLIEWKCEDVTEFMPAYRYSLWHDRAVFHFLTDESDRKKYRHVLESSVKVGGYVIIAAFTIGGAMKCSGLDTVQYDANKLTAELGKKFTFLNERFEKHITPSGKEQAFGYYLFTKNV